MLLAKKYESEIKNLLDYDPITGIICNKKSKKEIGYNHPTGYIHLKIKTSDNKFITLKSHRVAYFLMTGNWPKLIDHVNHDKKDNRWCNLRNVNFQESSRNQSKRIDNKSGVTGVYQLRSKWIAKISNGTVIHIGTFNSFQDAVKARKNAERELGYHLNHGL